MVTETGVIDLRNLTLSGKILHIGCLILLSIVFLIAMLLPLVGLLFGQSVFLRHVQTAEGVVTGFESVPVLRCGPDGEEYTAYDQHAVVRFQTADGTERTFTNEYRVPIRSTLKEGVSVTVRYNDARAMLADDYERNMAVFLRNIRLCVLLTGGYILITALIVMHGKHHKNKEKAAGSTGNTE